MDIKSYLVIHVNITSFKILKYFIIIVIKEGEKGIVQKNYIINDI